MPVRKRIGIVELCHPLDGLDVLRIKEITHVLSFTKLGGPG